MDLPFSDSLEAIILMIFLHATARRRRRRRRNKEQHMEYVSTRCSFFSARIMINTRVPA
jgi:uncharacterized membrane protein SirB2